MSRLKFFIRCGAIARVFDVIGDIHGHHTALRALLSLLGYQDRGGAWRFPGGRRRVLFVGDYIDRGPRIPEVVDLVRAMVEADSAVAILGNHEYNAIAWHTRDSDGAPLRAHTPGRRRQHARTLLQYESEGMVPSARLTEALAWFARLPIAFENDSLRAVHAAWDAPMLASLSTDRPLADRSFLTLSARRDRREYEIVERLLKGVEISLPPEIEYTDKDGTPRRKTRVRWWLDHGEIAKTYEKLVPLSAVAMPPVDTEFGSATVPAESLATLPGYKDDRPVFFGHYWLSGGPCLFADRIACLDYSIANDGMLCSYRFDGEHQLTADKFICVDAEGRRTV